MLELLNGLDLVAAIMTIAALGFMAVSHFFHSSASVESTIKRSLLNQIVIPRL
jgi:hypothetical protein